MEESFAEISLIIRGGNDFIMKTTLMYILDLVYVCVTNIYYHYYFLKVISIIFN